MSTDVGKDEEAFSDLEIGDSDEEILNKINPNENEEEGQLQVFKESVIKILLVCFFAKLQKLELCLSRASSVPSLLSVIEVKARSSIQYFSLLLFKARAHSLCALAVCGKYNFFGYCVQQPIDFRICCRMYANPWEISDKQLFIGDLATSTQKGTGL